MKKNLLILLLSHFSILLVSGQTNFDHLIEKKLELSHFWDLGYFDAKISENEDSVFIKRGDIYAINAVLISPETIQVQLTKSSYKGLDCSKENVLAIVKKLNDHLINDRRYFARIKNDSVQMNNTTKTANVFISIDNYEIQGKPELDFMGSKRYSKEYLKKVAGYSSSSFTQNFLSDSDRLRFRLMRSELFSTVSRLELFKSDSLIKAVFKVQEQNPNRFDLIAGYIPADDGGGQFVGSIEFDLVNMIREGQVLSVRFNRMQSLRTRLTIATRQNYLANSNFSVGLEFGLFQRDSIFQTQNWLIKTAYELNPFSAVEFFVRRDQVGAGLNATQYNTDGTAYYYGFSYLLDTTDDIFIPTKGVKLNVQSELGVKQNSDLVLGTIFPEKENKQRFKLGFDSFYSPFRRSVISSKVQGTYLLSNFYQDSDLLRFGGASSFRGYAEEQFAVSKAAWTDLEYRFLLDRTSYLFGFYSVGFFETPELLNDVGKIKGFSDNLQAYGFGLAYRTRLGLLTFTYAKSPQDSFDNAKIHFGIKGGL